MKTQKRLRRERVVNSFAVNLFILGSALSFVITMYFAFKHLTSPESVPLSMVLFLLFVTFGCICGLHDSINDDRVAEAEQREMDEDDTQVVS